MCLTANNIIQSSIIYGLLTSAVVSIDSTAGYGMYGIDYGVNLYKYDILNGNNSLLATTNSLFSTGAATGCLDDINNIYYSLCTEDFYFVSFLYPFNLNGTTNKYSKIQLPQLYRDENSYNTMNKACVVNQNNGEIFVFGPSAKNATNMLLLSIVFNPQTNTANIKQIGSNYDNMYSIFTYDIGLATYDSKRNMLWFAKRQNQTTQTLYHINALNGKINNSVTVNIHKYWYYGLYYAKLDVIVGIEIKTAKHFSFCFVYFDPTTLNVVKKFKVFDDVQSVYQAESTLDNKNGLFYTIFDYTDKLAGPSQLIGINITDGMIITNATICPQNYGYCPDSIQIWKR
eukprot:478953_1